MKNLSFVILICMPHTESQGAENCLVLISISHFAAQSFLSEIMLKSSFVFHIASLHFFFFSTEPGVTSHKCVFLTLNVTSATFSKIFP